MALSSSPRYGVHLSCGIYINMLSSPSCAPLCHLHWSLSSSLISVVFTDLCCLHWSLSSSLIYVVFTDLYCLHWSLSSSLIYDVFTDLCRLHWSMSSSLIYVVFTILNLSPAALPPPVWLPCHEGLLAGIGQQTCTVLTILSTDLVCEDEAGKKMC